MRRALTILSALALLLAASLAHRVKLDTRELEKSVALLSNEVAGRRGALAALNAEWAYLNRPERLLRLAAAYGEEMELKPRRPDSFSRLDEIPISGDRVTRRSAIPLDLSDLEAPVMGDLNPASAEASAAPQAPETPLFPDYEEVVTQPEFVGEGVWEDLAEGGLDPYAAALVESQSLPPPHRSGPVSGDPSGAPQIPGWNPAQNPAAGAGADFAPAVVQMSPGPPGAPPAQPVVYYGAPAPQAPASLGGAPFVGMASGGPSASPTGYALPAGAVIVPQGYPSAPAAPLAPTPYNGAAPGLFPSAPPVVLPAGAPQPVFAPNVAPPPRIEVWEPLP